MAYLNDRVLDNGLSVLTSEANRLDICSQQPASYTEAITTYSLGNKLAPTIGSPAARTPTGRKVTVSSIADGALTDDQNASHYALVDTVNSRLLAAGALNEIKAVYDGDAFTLTAFDIGIPAPA